MGRAIDRPGASVVQRLAYAYRMPKAAFRCSGFAEAIVAAAESLMRLFGGLSTRLSGCFWGWRNGEIALEGEDKSFSLIPLIA